MRAPTYISLIALSLFLASPTGAQEDDDGIEINLDALQSINPAREDTPPAPAEPPEPSTDTDDSDDAPLLPPGVDDEQSSGPPDLSRAPAPVLGTAEPQTPVAPRIANIEDAPATTPPALARAVKGRVDQLLFNEGDQALTLQGTEQLDAIVSQIAESAIRLELHAYGGTDKQSLTETKRLSLNRAIAVRGYLMGKGIDGTRISLRPKGPADKKEAPERVDIHFLVP
ncbi:MAG: OmpA family protein [Alphaproteobacteria bacterium]